MSQPTPGSNLRTRKPSDISSFCAFDAGFLGEAGGANARKKLPLRCGFGKAMLDHEKCGSGRGGGTSMSEISPRRIPAARE